MSAESSSALSRQMADEDLARRSRTSGIAYPVLFGTIILFTPYAHDHPVVATALSAVLLLCVSFRSWQVFGFNRIYPRQPDRWVLWFNLLTLLLAGTWGLFCAHAVLRYGLEWTAMLTLLSTAGIAAGAITTLSIRKTLIMLYLALLLLPPTVATALLQSRESFAITLMFLIYFAFMISVAKSIYKEYWKALDNTLLLDQHARELEASNQELESYSYSIAHDLRTPLRSIIGFSQILKEDLRNRLAPGETEDLNRVISAGKHMAKLIDDILELSRITRRNLEYSDIDLSELVQAQADSLASIDPDRSVSFKIQPGLRANGDSSLLTIALQNLTENAWKFTRYKEHAEIVFAAKTEENDTVYSLCDNGVGFDMAHAGNLFKPFDRLHSQEEFPGTGIGLATVQRIIQRHGGRVWAQSTPGQGACFYFTLK
jgi:signal transduction histidine kinase